MKLTVTVVNEHRDRVDFFDLLTELADNNGASEWSRHRLCVELADLIDADVIEDITASTPPVETVEVDVTAEAGDAYLVGAVVEAVANLAAFVDRWPDHDRMTDR